MCVPAALLPILLSADGLGKRNTAHVRGPLRPPESWRKLLARAVMAIWGVNQRMGDLSLSLSLSASQIIFRKKKLRACQPGQVSAGFSWGSLRLPPTLPSGGTATLKIAQRREANPEAPWLPSVHAEAARDAQRLTPGCGLAGAG